MYFFYGKSEICRGLLKLIHVLKVQSRWKTLEKYANKYECAYTGKSLAVGSELLHEKLSKLKQNKSIIEPNYYLSDTGVWKE